MTETHDVILLYVPCGSDVEALRMIRALLEEGLVACGNIYETRSVYFWKGELADEKEYVLVCKTTPGRADAAATKVRELHSYEIPCVLRIEPAKANREYAAWVRSEVASGARTWPVEPRAVTEESAQMAGAAQSGSGG